MRTKKNKDVPALIPGHNMPIRTLGSSSLRVSAIGLGMAALGRPGYINLGHAGDLGRNYDVPEMERHAHEVLETAWLAGVTYFDAARSYGRGEAFLGSWLKARQLPADSVTVGSKWGYIYTAGWQVQAAHHEIKEHTLPNLQRQWGESREILGSSLDLYQIHSATLDSGVLENVPVLEELGRIKGEGVLIGLSVSGPAQADTLRRAMEIRLDGQRLFDSVQATWNLLERSAGEALREAHQAGLGVMIKEAVANGRLTGRNRSPSFARQRALLEKQATRLETSLDAMALAFVLAQAWVDVVLSGAATVSQLQSNMGALDVDWDEEAGAALAPLVESPQDYWETRAQLDWN